MTYTLDPCVTCGYDLGNDDWNRFPELLQCRCAPLRAALGGPDATK